MKPKGRNRNIGRDLFAADIFYYIPVRVDEDVIALDVPVDDLHVVEVLETLQHLKQLIY